MKSSDTSQGPSVHLRRASDGDEITVALEEFEELIRKGQVGPQTRVRFSLVTGEHWANLERAASVRMPPPKPRPLDVWGD